MLYLNIIFILTDLTWLVLYCTCTCQDLPVMIMLETNICKKFKMASILMTIALIWEQLYNFWLTKVYFKWWPIRRITYLVRVGFQITKQVEAFFSTNVLEGWMQSWERAKYRSWRSHYGNRIFMCELWCFHGNHDFGGVLTV